MEPVSGACLAIAGKGLICLAGAFDLTVVGSVVTLGGQEIVRAATRNRQDWHDYKNAYHKLNQLAYTSSIVTDLAKKVLQGYTPSWKCWNWVGTGSSDSSRELYEGVKVTSDHYGLLRLFQLYLCHQKNNGKALEVLMRNYIMNY